MRRNSRARRGGRAAWVFVLTAALTATLTASPAAQGADGAAEASAIAAADAAASNDPRLLNDVVAIAAGEAAVYAVKADGTAWAWGGKRDSGLLGNGSTVPVLSPVRMRIDGVKDIAGGAEHTLILKTDGTVWATGSNRYGQLGVGDASLDSVTVPVQVPGLEDIAAIAAANHHSVALQKDGTVWQWGMVDPFLAGNPEPKKVEGLPPVNAVSAGYMYGIALGGGGEVWTWGAETTSESQADRLKPPTQVKGLDEARGISAGRTKTAAIGWTGDVYAWRSMRTFDSWSKLHEPVHIQDAFNVVQLEGGNTADFFTFRKADGTVWFWDMYWEQSAYQAKRAEGIEGAVDLANSWTGRYALLSNGTVVEFDTSSGDEPPTVTPVHAAVRIVLEGEPVELTVPPRRIGGSYYVPLRGVFEHLGAEVRWIPERNAVYAKKDATTIEMDMASKRTTVNGVVVPVDLSPVSVNYVTMVPLRFLAETLGYRVEWREAEHTIAIERSRE